MNVTIYEENELPPLLSIVEEQGFVIFKKGLYNLNIIGVRNPHPEPNTFDDILYVIHKEEDEDDIIWKCYEFKCTTDPGFYWLLNGKRKDGCAILAHPQQCRGAYKIDMHQGKYKALCQRLKPVWVWRDNNKDFNLDYGGQLYKVDWGINIHRASKHFNLKNVNKYSAGCTVIQNPDDFNCFMQLCYNQINHGMGSSFTYTIIEGV